jgi:hypothetical protein
VRRAVATVVGLWLSFVPAIAGAQEPGSPHYMVKPDGELDMDSCLNCHEEDMSLSRSKLETCTLCHGQTPHAGSDEHVRASPSSVKEALARQPEGGPAFPLTDDGRIYCGTCHFFHDPHVMEEKWLSQGWLPAESGLSGVIRQGVVDRWNALAARGDESDALGEFATKGTRQLRLPVDEGQLCRQCHVTLR